MHPPQKLRSAARTAMVVLAALLAVLAAAGPASAATPLGYETEALGEDFCTRYSTAGEAEWADIAVQPTVAFTGKAWTTFFRDGRICLGVEPRARHLEFVAYDAKGTALDVERLAAPARDSSYGYAFALTADETTSIDHVTVAICRTEPTTGAPGVPSQHCAGMISLYPPA
ncbi:hypothetical protein [Glycomyces niveus]|uniref:Uncharacterized protein n=1 Tax=Glycomyces niveus TaxID=2820287 RepID=A0ABS3TY78_9ACTN|nr:hypothetical protein [Glycomyces sp. NEAU-S30]MBO3731451.1 hypothetical protein [Glycomyces sp. NEAU-S30]